MIWATGSAVAYQQIGANAQGNWQVNTAAGCSGTIAGVTPSAGPSADLIEVVINGVTTNQLLIAWTQNNASPANTVYTTTITPSYTPLYTDVVPNTAAS